MVRPSTDELILAELAVRRQKNEMRGFPPRLSVVRETPADEFKFEAYEDFDTVMKNRDQYLKAQEYVRKCQEDLIYAWRLLGRAREEFERSRRHLGSKLGVEPMEEK